MKSKNQRRRERKKLLKSQNEEAADGVKQVDGSDELSASDEVNGSVDASNGDANSDANSKTKLSVLSRKYNWMSETDPLYEMYRSVTSRLRKRPRSEPKESETEPQELPPASKKQQRLAAKPSLASLKARTPFPELIEWYDADARYPEFLVQMKSVPHAVQVPSNWRLRQEIPHFAAKEKYEVPEPIKSRAPAAADVDYELLHSLFFGPQAVYKNDHRLPFGHVVDLNLRRRAFKSRTEPVAPPKQLSARLRSALQLKPHDAPPWAEYVKEHGLAPGYSDVTPLKLWGEAKK